MKLLITSVLVALAVAPTAAARIPVDQSTGATITLAAPSVDTMAPPRHPRACWDRFHPGLHPGSDPWKRCGTP